MNFQKSHLFSLRYWVLMLCVVAVSLSSCSKDDDNGDGPSSDKRIKITISSSDTFSKQTGGDLSISVGSFDGSSKPQRWTIDGKETGAETLHTLSSNDFEGGKTHVLESQAEYAVASVTINGFSIDRSFVLKYTIQQGSKVIADEEVELYKDRDVFVKNYTFPQ